MSVWHISRKACPVGFHHWFPGKLRAPWRQAQLEPPTRPWQAIGYAWTQHPPGTLEAMSIWACLTARFRESHRTEAEPGHTQEDDMSHTLFAVQPTEGLGGAHAWDFLSSSYTEWLHSQQDTGGQCVGERAALRESCLVGLSVSSASLYLLWRWS